jgi:alkanesulfonate monooxygenase SsuD/methylene tetrahydromethanopterin reductase-like flavin-dependent oxidoreductase (luciferase family)
MQVGVMVTSYNQKDWDRLLAGRYDEPPLESDVEIVDETIRLGDMVEPLGYDAIWCAEHYGSAYSMQGNPLQWLAFWAGRTERVDLGTAVIVAPWWQPTRLVHEVAMVDLLLRGRRLHLGVGRGVAAHEYAAFGVPLEESRVRFREMIEILRLSDTQESFSYEGEAYSLPEMSVRPQARHKGGLTGRLKAAFNTPSSMQVAAELGLGQLFVASETVDQMRRQVAKFNAVRQAQGLGPDQPTTMCYVHCSDDPDELEAGRRFARAQGWAARNHYGVWKAPDFGNVKGYEEYAKIFSQKSAPQASDSPSKIGLEKLQAAELIGTPEQILERIQALQEAISLEYLIVHPAHGGKPPEQARASLELFAKEVLPVVQAMPTPLHDHSKGSPDLLDADLDVTSGAVGS